MYSYYLEHNRRRYRWIFVSNGIILNDCKAHRLYRLTQDIEQSNAVFQTTSFPAMGQQKRELHTGNPSVQFGKGEGWVTTQLYFIWDGNDVPGHNGELTKHFTGDKTNGLPEQAGYTDPSKFDTDGDQLSDGQEVNGWTVTIILEKTMEKVNGRERQVYSNPLVEDTDTDDLYDYNEFLNQADPTMPDTDLDGIPDSEDIGACWLIEGQDPKLVLIESWKAGYLGDHIKVRIKATDNGGVDKVGIDLYGVGWQYFYGYGGKEVEFVAEWTVDLTHIKQWILDGFDVNADISDFAGNGIKANTHVSSLLSDAVGAFIKAIQPYADFLKELPSKAIDWLWEKIQWLITNVIKPIIDGVASYYSGIINAIYRVAFSFDITSNSLTTEQMDCIAKAFFGPLWPVFEFLEPTMEFIYNLIKPFVKIIEDLIDKVTGFIVDTICSLLGALTESKDKSFMSLLTNTASLDKSLSTSIFGHSSTFLENLRYSPLPPIVVKILAVTFIGFTSLTLSLISVGLVAPDPVHLFILVPLTIFVVVCILLREYIVSYVQSLWDSEKDKEYVGLVANLLLSMLGLIVGGANTVYIIVTIPKALQLPFPVNIVALIIRGVCLTLLWMFLTTSLIKLIETFNELMDFLKENPAYISPQELFS